MTTLSEKRIVDGSLPDVFAYVADFANVAEWDPGVVASRRIDEGPLGVSSRFAVTATFGGRTLDLAYEMTGYVENELAVLEVHSPRFDAVDTIRFRSVDDSQTEVDYTAEFTLKGVMRLVAPLLRGTFDRLAKKALDGLVANRRSSG